MADLTVYASGRFWSIASSSGRLLPCSPRRIAAPRAEGLRGRDPVEAQRPFSAGAAARTGPCLRGPGFRTKGPGNADIGPQTAARRLRSVRGMAGRKKARIPREVYERELLRLQAELVKLQEWVRAEGARLVVVFEGRDAAGKGSTIKRVTEHLNPRVVRIAALPGPTERERTQWYFQRYIEHLPAAGEIVLFDRSWYNRAGVERVMGFCTPEEHRRFLQQCPIFERLLVDDGVLLRKYWFSASLDEQERRFRARIDDPMRRWKLSTIDLQSV